MFPVLIAGLMVFSACENDIEKVNEITRSNNRPSLVVKEIETVYSDSGVVKVKMFAPKLIRYEKLAQPFDEYPEGLTVHFYSSDFEITGKLDCEYAKYLVDENLWEARSNVETQNILTGEKLNTELLFWNIEKEIIYSDAFVRITTKDEVIFGNGFESNQDFSKWKILNPKGTINIEDNDPDI